MGSKSPSIWPSRDPGAAMADNQAFEDVMIRLRAGDEEAARHIFQRFAQRLISLARSRLSSSIRQKVDPEDVLQSVFRSFFTRYSGGEFDVNDWDNLWSLLTVITLRKCGHRAEFFRAACRDLQREQPMQSAGLDWEAVAREPTPSEAAILIETLEQVMRELNERERQMLQLSLHGYTASEISAQLDCSTRKVQRVKKRVVEHLQRLRAESG